MMHNFITNNKLKSFYLLIIIIVIAFGNNICYANQSRNLIIFADQSTVFSLTKIARLYSQKYNVATSINFIANSEIEEDMTLNQNGDSHMISRIESGEAADVFISANNQIINELKRKGLIDFYSNSFIAFDRLAIITSKQNQIIKNNKIKFDTSFNNALLQLDQLNAIILTENINNIAGKNAFDRINSLDLKNIQIISKIKEDRSSIYSITKDNPDNYVIALASQVFNRKNIKVIALDSQEINYQALAITGDNMNTAREFIKFLKSDIAKKIFNENGFIAK